MTIAPRRLLQILAAAGLLYWMQPKPATAATPLQVDAALDRAKAFLYSMQTRGLWERRTAPTAAEVAEAPHSEAGGQWGGLTALAVYALLASGESPLDPRLVPAIKFLRSADIKGMYALGLRAQLYNFLPPTRDVRLEAQQDAVRIESAVFKTGPATGLFDYLLTSQRNTRFDHSVSQYGVLGMWACERSGVEVPTPFWQSVESAWIRDQAKDGSWSYGEGASERRGPTASMTVAGVATLFITQDYVHPTNGLACNGNVINPNIEAGLKWIDTNFEKVFTDETALHPYYGLYGVERVGVASGRKYLGTVNWYQRGADYLISQQSPRGSWGSPVETCFAMLFLARGRAPVLFNKLQYDVNGKEGGWNERPRDIANLTRWISKKTERDLNWQIVNLKGSATELLDAPVMYIAGSKPLAFSEPELAKLREYVEDGGLIMGNPDCGSSAFAESFRKLGSKLFHDYEFRNIPIKHPIFTNQQYPRSSWKPAPTVLGLSNGVREMMVLTNNSDPARNWQTEETGRNLADFQLADDVVLYAIDKNNLNEKGQTWAVAPDPAVKPDRSIKVARLQWAGNWNPEPGGWRRMAALLRNRSHIALDLSVAKLGAGQLGDGKSGAKVAVLTGTNTCAFNEAARAELKTFLNSGGTLIIDAAGGDGDFATSVETELQTILGGDTNAQLKAPVPESAAIYKLKGGAIKEFSYRPFARVSLGVLHTPLLAAVKVNGRPAVYYSRIDLSAGLVGQPTDGILGYSPETATAIMTNLVISAALGDDAAVSPNQDHPATAPAVPSQDHPTTAPAVPNRDHPATAPAAPNRDHPATAPAIPNRGHHAAAH